MLRIVKMSLALSVLACAVHGGAQPTPTATAAQAQAKTRSVLLKVDVDFKDPTLSFLLDEREISAKMLQAPLQLTFGRHELVVLHNSEPVASHQFDVGPKTGAEIVLKRNQPLPAENDPDFPPPLNLNVKPVTPPAPNRDEPRRKGEWIQLFNGKNLAGWRMRPQNPGDWRVENGILTCDGGRFGHLFTMEDDWTDVHLRMVARAKNAGTGVCIRAPFNMTPGDECFHVVIGGDKKTLTGSTIIAGRNTGDVKKKPVPPNTWFNLEVIVRGHHIVTKINGSVVGDDEDTQKTYSKGYIALNHRGDKSAVEFKSIEVRDLAPQKLLAKLPKVLPKSADHGKHAVQVIALPEALAHRAHVMIARAPGGGFKLGWNDAKGRAHVTTLGEDLKSVGADILVPDTELRGLAVNDDGTIVTLAFQPPCQMVALGLKPAGGELFKTVLSGEKGNGPGTRFAQKWYWAGRLVSAGQEFAVHYGHFNHLKGGAKHQGGCYARLDSKGNIIKYDGWTVSHSIDQALLYHRGHFLTASVGDAFPVGIPFNNRTFKAGSLLYPVKDERDAFQPKTTHLSSMVTVGDDVGLAFSTRVGETWKAFYVVTDTVGEVKRFVQVLDKVPTKHFGVNLAPYGSDLLLFWTQSDTITGYVPMDRTGRFLAKPTLVEEAIGRRNDFAFFPNGDVGWLTARPGATEVNVVRVRW